MFTAVRHNRQDRILINLVHDPDLGGFVCFIVLEDANSINPQVLFSYFSRERHRISDGTRQTVEVLTKSTCT